MLLGGNYGGTWPSRHGYQNVERVIESGPGCTRFAVDQIVLSGQDPHVEYFVLPAPDPTDVYADLVVTLPDDLDRRQAALLGVAAVATHDVRRAAPTLGERALVVGAGLIGLVTAQVARLTGADVTICDRDESRLEVAASLGVRAIATGAGWDPVRAAGPFDVIFEDTGADVLHDLLGSPAAESLAFRGRLVLVGGRNEVASRFNHAQELEATVLHAGHFVRSDLELAAQRAVSGELRLGPLLRDVVPVSDAPAIYELLRDDPSRLLGTVFDWGKDAPDGSVLTAELDRS